MPNLLSIFVERLLSPLQTLVWLVCFPAENRAAHLRSASQKRYRLRQIVLNEARDGLQTRIHYNRI